MLVGRRIAAAGVVMRPLHRSQLGVEVELFAGFEEQDVEASRHEDMPPFPRRPRTR